MTHFPISSAVPRATWLREYARSTLPDYVVFKAALEPARGRPPAGKPRKPSLASVAKQASKAGISVARYELKPDGSVVVVTGTPEPIDANPWDEIYAADKKRPS
jgi:hypothetical protein